MTKRVKVRGKRHQKRKAVAAFREQPVSEETREFDFPTIPLDFYYLLALGKPKLRYFLLSIDTICIVIILGVSITFTLFRVPDLSRIPQMVLTLMGSVFMACAITRASMFIRLLVNREKARTDPKYILSVNIANFLCNIISATLFTMICFYYLGVIDFIAYVLHTYWPKLSEKLSYGISTALGWIVSGVIGNAAYDVIKRKLRKREAESHNNHRAPEHKAAPNNSFNRTRD
jgi:hypothetical protein